MSTPGVTGAGHHERPAWSNRPDTALAAGLASVLDDSAVRHGADTSARAALARAVTALVAAGEAGQVCLPLTALTDDPASLRARLLSSGVVGPADGAPRPLVLDSAGRLYLYRYHRYEVELAANLLRRAAGPDAAIPADTARQLLDQTFAANTQSLPAGVIDLQKLAAGLALLRPLTILSGGPGTGKTTTVFAMLRCLLALAPGLRIALAAPTGKAAARLLEALRQHAALAGAPVAGLPDQAHTVHRLLRPVPGTTRFRHDARHPLPLDVLVVDEASMLDLALATKLLAALPENARLILLGDKDQLAAVEAGSIFHALAARPGLSPARAERLAALCGVAAAQLPAAEPGPFVDTTVWLERNYRFAADSAIGRLATALRDAGRGAPAALEALQAAAARDHHAPSRSTEPPDGPRRPLGGAATWDGVRLIDTASGPLEEAVLRALVDGYADYLALLGNPEPDPAALLRALEAHRVLCVLRNGERGVERLNLEISRRLLQRLDRPWSPVQPWWAGRPVLIRANDYGLRLYNGDLGVALPAPGRRDRMLVWLPDGQGGLRPVAAARLPDHETAFACTVHKAQGSEFDRISLILPDHDTALLNRPLIYTALTRARLAAQLIGPTGLLALGVQRAGAESSGLEDRLRHGVRSDI